MTRSARILEVTSYPPPRAGWGIRVEFLKKRLEREGHQCIVLNIGVSRAIPSPEYETVLGAGDLARKVWRYAGRGFLVHTHANGDSVKGLILALSASVIALLRGRRPVLTFHAGAIQRYFPLQRNRRMAPLFWLLFVLSRRIICNSDAVKACIAGYGVSRDKIVPIPAFSREYLEFTATELPEHLTAFLRKYPMSILTYLRMRVLFYPVTLIDGMATVMARRPDVGLVICGGKGHMDEGVWPAVEEAITRHDLGDRICFVDDLDHDSFLTAMQRVAIYLRTPFPVVVASSVLDALGVRGPVGACVNGTRPAGVLTYPAEDAQAMADAVDRVLSDRESVVAGLASVALPDTLTDEIRLLTTSA
jgi:glycosyltransferase involved in cell wall biosynthesis